MPVPDLTLHPGPPPFSRHEKLKGEIERRNAPASGSPSSWRCSTPSCTGSIRASSKPPVPAP
jgi:hypothetical protein